MLTFELEVRVALEELFCERTLRPELSGRVRIIWPTAGVEHDHFLRHVGFEHL